MRAVSHRGSFSGNKIEDFNMANICGKWGGKLTNEVMSLVQSGRCAIYVCLVKCCARHGNYNIYTALLAVDSVVHTL